MKNIFFLQFSGKRGRAQSDRSFSSEHESAEQGHVVGEFSEAKSRLLLPPIILEPEKEQTSTSKFLKNGSEFRRSLRRINSLTRRKLSPSSHNAPEVCLNLFCFSCLFTSQWTRKIKKVQAKKFVNSNM